ncbi:hypothetical protein H0H87_006547 [Tephrocybe sp. NHM501043]|nr:hypothetical protein H0H87_006547 [Tephrocybe sp. NHM501043]
MNIGGSAIFRAAYVADLAFTRAQVADGVLQSAEYSTHINKPVPWNEAFGSNFKCENRTGDRQNIGIGFYEPGKNKPTSALVVTDVPWVILYRSFELVPLDLHQAARRGNTDVVASFTPILSAYVVTGYQENQILKAQIRGGLDWAKDLADNRIDKNWLLTESNDGFHLIRDDEA